MELKEWAGRIGSALAAGGDVFCYFKHEDEGASPKMAKRLFRALQERGVDGLATDPPQSPASA